MNKRTLRYVPENNIIINSTLDSNTTPLAYVKNKEISSRIVNIVNSYKSNNIAEYTISLDDNIDYNNTSLYTNIYKNGVPFYYFDLINTNSRILSFKIFSNNKEMDASTYLIDIVEFQMKIYHSFENAYIEYVLADKTVVYQLTQTLIYKTKEELMKSVGGNKFLIDYYDRKGEVCQYQVYGNIKPSLSTKTTTTFNIGIVPCPTLLVPDEDRENLISNLKTYVGYINNLNYNNILPSYITIKAELATKETLNKYQMIIAKGSSIDEIEYTNYIKNGGTVLFEDNSTDGLIIDGTGKLIVDSIDYYNLLSSEERSIGNAAIVAAPIKELIIDLDNEVPIVTIENGEEDYTVLKSSILGQGKLFTSTISLFNTLVDPEVQSTYKFFVNLCIEAFNRYYVVTPLYNVLLYHKIQLYKNEAENYFIVDDVAYKVISQSIKAYINQEFNIDIEESCNLRVKTSTSNVLFMGTNPDESDLNTDIRILNSNTKLAAQVKNIETNQYCNNLDTINLTKYKEQFTTLTFKYNEVTYKIDLKLINRKTSFDISKIFYDLGIMEYIYNAQKYIEIVEIPENTNIEILKDDKKLIDYSTFYPKVLIDDISNATLIIENLNYSITSSMNAIISVKDFGRNVQILSIDNSLSKYAFWLPSIASFEFTLLSTDTQINNFNNLNTQKIYQEKMIANELAPERYTYKYNASQYIGYYDEALGEFINLDLNPIDSRVYTSITYNEYGNKIIKHDSLVSDLLEVSAIYFVVYPSIANNISRIEHYVGEEEMISALKNKKGGLLLGYINFDADFSPELIQITDIRNIGESISDSKLTSLSNTFPYIWDTNIMTKSYFPNGIIKIKINKEVLNNFTDLQVKEIIKEHLAFGIYFIVEYI